MTDIAETHRGARKGRILVLCFDGTDREFEEKNTNVVKFFALLEKNNPRDQLCYYQPGVGTYFKPGVVSPFLRWIASALDEAFAWYLDAHVLGGYEYLMENYKDGDKICLFGFSRGAYIARALAGFLHKVGLLPKMNAEQMPFAYKMYKRKDQKGIELAVGFKRTFCRDVKIEFVGVWDTVSSVGAITGRTLPFTSSNKAIKTFRHALALDEHRAKFRPNLYHQPAPDAMAAALDPQHASFYREVGTISTIKARFSGGASLGTRSNRVSREDMEGMKDQLGRATDVLEVWFSGCHNDIGGSAVRNSTKKSLSSISLRWMVNEVMKSQCGILFDGLALARASIPVPIFPGMPVEHIPRVVKLDAEDALQPTHDRLKELPIWWLLEFMCFSHSWQDADGVWHRKFRINFGRGREIQASKPFFHHTVKQRMESQSNYSPRAKWSRGSEIYV